jgi:hypothetical protein
MPGFDELWFNRRDAFEQEACDVTIDALRRAGWKYTSQTPRSVWMWQKEIDGKLYSVSQGDAAAIQERAARSAYFKQFPDELSD